MAVRTPTLAQGVLRDAGLARQVLIVIAFSAFIAVSAQIAIPFWPVPLTGQTLAVLLTGAVLGPWLGSLAVLTYLAEGALGLPVFAGGASGWQPTRIPGVPYIFGTTAGYLVGFVFAAGLVGWLAQRGWDRSFPRAAAAMVIGSLVIYLMGAAWLTRFVPIEGVLAAGVLPFVPGDLIKIALAAAALPGAWALLGRRPSS